MEGMSTFFGPAPAIGFRQRLHQYADGIKRDGRRTYRKTNGRGEEDPPAVKYPVAAVHNRCLIQETRAIARGNLPGVVTTHYNDDYRQPGLDG